MDPENQPGTRRDDLSRDRIRALAKAWEQAVQRLERRYRLVARSVVAALLLALAAITLTIALARHQASERQDSQIRAIAYRVCQREANHRAYEHTRHTGAELREIERKLPILDCEPNITGGPAHPLSTAEQRDFVRRFDAENLTPREQGICRERLPDTHDEPVC